MSGGIAAVLLAAGESRRMGAPKASVRLCGWSLLEWVYDSIHSSRVFDEVLAVLRPGFDPPEGLSMEPIYNYESWRGLASSLSLGLSRAREKGYYGAAVFHVDMPLIRPSTIRMLAGEFVRLWPDLLRPAYRGSPGFPVFAGPPAMRASTLAWGDTGLRRVEHLLYRVLRIEVDDPGVAVDLDTPEDIARVGRLLGCES